MRGREGGGVMGVSTVGCWYSCREGMLVHAPIGVMQAEQLTAVKMEDEGDGVRSGGGVYEEQG